MVKIFREQNLTTVVFPASKETDEAIERICREIFPSEEKKETTVEGLVPSSPPSPKGVEVVSKERKGFKNQNLLSKDARNPFPEKRPFDVFVENGLSVLKSYHAMRLGETPYDKALSRELFSDILRYLVSIDNNEWYESASENQLKDTIHAISTKLYRVPMDGILKRLGIETLDEFLASASNNQLGSACVKTVKDTIQLLRRQ